MTYRPKSQIGVGGLVLGPRERKYLGQVIRSSRLSYGPMTRRFERRFAAFHRLDDVLQFLEGGFEGRGFLGGRHGAA